MIRSAALGIMVALASSASAQAQSLREAVVVYLELAGDARYEPVKIGRLTLEEKPRPWNGVELAFADARATAQAAGVLLKLERAPAPDAAALVDLAREAIARGVHHLIVDAPADALRKTQDALGDRAALLYNVSAGDDELRGAACSTLVTHVTPSDAMRADALAQFLISRKWRTALALQGPAQRDAVRTDAFVKAFTKFGGRIVARKSFVIGSDPRAREQNDPALLTAGGDHDVVFVADVSTEFARELAYRTSRPRPVVGDAGLRPLTWSWTWDRYGAPQLNVRFARANGGRRMEDADWAGWMAGRMIAEAETRGGTDLSRKRAIIQDARFDGVKGVAVSVRRWDGQLRQPVLLATDAAVVAAAPLPGFLHATDTLDSLGPDVQESACQQRK